MYLLVLSTVRGVSSMIYVICSQVKGAASFVDVSGFRRVSDLIHVTFVCEVCEALQHVTRIGSCRFTYKV